MGKVQMMFRPQIPGYLTAFSANWNCLHSFTEKITRKQPVFFAYVLMSFIKEMFQSADFVICCSLFGAEARKGGRVTVKRQQSITEVTSYNIQVVYL